MKNLRLQYSKPGTFIASVTTLLTGNSIAQAIPLAIAPILTRIYSPNDFGIFALYLAIVSVFSIIATGRYENAIMLPEEDRDAVNLCAFIVVITSLASIVLLFLIVMFGDGILYLLKCENMTEWLYFIPVSVFFSGVYQVITYLSNRNRHYKSLATSLIFQSTSAAVANLGSGYLRCGALGLVSASIIGQIAAIYILAKNLYNYVGFDIKQLSKYRMLTQARRYHQFPKFNMAAMLVNTISTQLPMLVLSVCFSNSIVGFYSIAQKFITVPISLLGSSVTQVFLQKATELRAELLSLKELTFSVYKKLFYIGIGPVAIIAGFSDYLFEYIFGKPWIVAGMYSQALSILVLFAFIASPLSSLFTVLEKQKQGLIFTVLLSLSDFFSLLLGAVWFNDAYMAVLLYGITEAMCWAGLCLYLLKLVNVHYSSVLLFTLPKLLSVFGVVWLLRCALIEIR